MSNPNDFVIENGVLKKYRGSGGDVVVPEGVTSIGYSAFKDCRSLKSITLPKSMTSIGKEAFYGCKKLTSVTLPKGVTSIGDTAFWGCSSLTSVTLPEGVTSIGRSAFEDCSSLTSVTLPKSMTSIGDSAFQWCSSLTSITLPEGVTSIGRSAFWGCSSLTSITLPESVTSIGDGAFWRCSSLKSITLPEGVTSIEDSAFEDCRSLTSVTLPQGVTSIGHLAFYRCSSLTSIILPKGMTSIGYRAFYDCRSLTSVTLPEGMTSIGSYAFSGCSNLTSVTLPEGVTSIGSYAFSGCSSLTSVTLPEGVTSIEDGAFEGCSSLTGITLPQGVTSIGDSAFRGCSSLTSINLPESLTSIGQGAFGGCRVLADANGFVIVKEILFDYTGPGGDVVVPEGVTSIDESAFSGCSSLTSVTLPEGVTSIGRSAFYDCRSLTSITLPEGVTSIDEYVFRGCRSLTNITLPEGVTSIGSYAFYDCSSLKSITLPESLTSIGSEAFSGCDRMQSFVLNSKKVKINNDLFGESLPLGIADAVKELYPNMSDGALKRFVLVKEHWETLNETQREKIFLSRQGKALESAYLACVTAEQLEPLGQAVLTRLQAVRPSTKDCAAAAAYMTLFFDSAPLAILKALYQGLKQVKNGAKALKTVENHAKLMKRLKKSAEKDAALLPVERMVSEIMLAENLDKSALKLKLKDYIGLDYLSLPRLKTAEGKESEPYVLAWLLTAHEKLSYNYWGSAELEAARTKPGLRQEAVQIVSMLDQASLNSALMRLADQCLVGGESSKKKFFAYPFCRYADEAIMAELTKRAPKWRSSVSGDNAPPLRQLRDAALYSDTRAAMLFAERYHELDKYAAIRGVTEDELRDKYLSDVGLDEQGGKAYDLWNQTVTARLQKDLSFLVELPNGKTAKSLPKKGADAEKYEAANKDFSDMKKNAKKILKNRSKVLFEDFLSGRERPSVDWQSAYLQNPLLRIAASLVVWAQGKQTFTLMDGGPIDSAKQPYAITDEPIRVAHPMEMAIADVTAWQKHFTGNGLKQPLAQVWEPVREPEQIKPDRYSGSVLGLYSFSGKEKHGIHGGSIHAYSEEFGFSLDECKLEYEASTWRLDFDNFMDVTFTLGKFSFEKYTRKVNHIVSILDGMTVGARVQKDDLSVMDLMPGFTLAQITEFIQAAQEANATNVLAALLEYKNKTFPDFDPMDEFTLEW